MDKETLEARRDALQSSFDVQTKLKSDAEAEQLRLQGEYRLLNALIEEYPEDNSVVDAEIVETKTRKKKGK